MKARRVRCTAISLARRPDRWSACEAHLRSVLPDEMELDMFEGCDAKEAVGSAQGLDRVEALEAAFDCKIYRGWPITEVSDVRRCFPELRLPRPRHGYARA